MNETLSQSQAMEIVKNVNDIMMRCKTQIETKNDDFVQKVSTIWEDRNAVDYFKKHKQCLESIIKNLNNNNKTFADAVENIANYYSRVGNINRISVDRINMTPNIQVGAIKEYFANSENSDDFGFVNPQNGSNQVMDAFDQLMMILNDIATETVSAVNNINAFGNTKIKLELSRSAGNIIQIIRDNINAARNIIDDFLDQTAQGYIKAGQSALDAIHGISGEESSNSDSVTHPEPIEVLDNGGENTTTDYNPPKKDLSTDAVMRDQEIADSIRNGDFDF